MVLAALNALVESEVNPWLHRNAGVQIAQIDLTQSTTPGQPAIQLQLTLHKIPSKTP